MCCQELGCCKKNIFGVQLQRRHRVTCPTPDCCDGLMTSTQSCAETWSVLLLESARTGESSLLDLLAQYVQPVPVTLRCNSCKGSRQGQQQVSIESMGSALVLGFPRAGALDAEGVQHHHRGRVVCQQDLTFAGKDFQLSALIEHISGSTDARYGHFVTWVRKSTGWTRFDDLSVEKKPDLPEQVYANVVLAFYCAAALLPSSEQPGCCESLKSAEKTGSSAKGSSVHELGEEPELQAPPPTSNEDAREACQNLAQAGCMAEATASSKPSASLGGLLPQGCDGHLEFEEAVENLLAAYSGGTSTVLEELRSLPLFSCEVAEATWEDLCQRLRVSVQEDAKQSLVAADAAQLPTPLWRTTFFPLAVLFEAWSRTTGLPAIFHTDSFYSLVGSLLNKHISYDVAGFPARARCWAVGTAFPGSGKSPTLEPLKQALLEVLLEMPELAPGLPADGFHVQPVGTHAAAVDRLRSTGGYQVIGAGEGGPVLCPAWPSSATWTQSTHINWQRYLDSATGKAAPNVWGELKGHVLQQG